MTVTTPTQMSPESASTYADAIRRAREIERRAHDEIRKALLEGSVDPDTFDLAPSLPPVGTSVGHDTAFVRECLVPLARVMAYVKQAHREGLHPHSLAALLVMGPFVKEDGTIADFPPEVDFDFAYNAVSWVDDVRYQVWRQS